jgi:hypothetical protein
MEYKDEMPFSSYDELVKAIYNDKAALSFSRATAYNLSNRSGHIGFILSGLGVVFGFLVLFVFSHFFIHNYWVMLFAIVLLLLNTIVPHIRKPLLSISIVLCILPLIIQKVIWLSAIGFSLIALYIGYEIWWGVVYNKARSMLLMDKSLFEQVWQSGSMAVKTIDGKLFVHKI